MMPQQGRDKSIPHLFLDLGKATKRGVRLCPKCSTLNGTRGNVCKNKSCDVVFRDSNGSKRKTTTDACRLATSGFEQDIYSVRIRDRGPDYRSFVHLPIQTGKESPKCYVESCLKSGVISCYHIKSAQNCFSSSQPILIKTATLANLNIPFDAKEQLQELLMKELPDQLIQRVSKTSFIVKCQTSPRHPLGFLHILFFKPNTKEFTATDSIPKFLCTCRPIKLPSNRNEAETESVVLESSSKLCVHYYGCICAFASHEDLELEFEHFVSHAICQEHSTQRTGGVRPPGRTLGEMDLISDSNPEVIDLEPMDENQMEAEIIRENISLLESIAAADDATLPNSLESVLTDQIIVTNVDDSLNFGDSSALDGLDDPEAQVSGHLTHISEILSQPNPNQSEGNIYTSSGEYPSTGDAEDDGSDFHLDIPSSTSSGRRQYPRGTASTFRKTKRRKKIVLSLSGSEIGSTSPNIIGAESCETESRLLPVHNRPGLGNGSGFELWLAGVNERINSTMNYQFDGHPDPYIMLVPQEHFELLKERITSGWQKKRLPNQTMVIHQRDRPPLGVFTKHVWRITNVVHVLQIFQNSIVPLKLNQFFKQSAGGSFDEWTSNPLPSSGDDGSKNTPIIPVLHSTSLRIGKIDATKEMVPFIIEWTADVLPVSRHGELSLTFQFHHSPPIHTEEEKRNACAHLMKLLSSHNVVLSKQDLIKIGLPV